VGTLLVALREFGYTEGKNITFAWQSSGGQAERFGPLPEDLTRVRVDVIVAPDNPAVAAARKATRTIPIVMVLAQDPVSSGFGASLARSGGNVTGLSASDRPIPFCVSGPRVCAAGREHSMKARRWLQMWLALLIASGCVQRTDWIEGTLVTVDVTGRWARTWVFPTGGARST